jgi:hypothetical protein
MIMKASLRICVLEAGTGLPNSVMNILLINSGFSRHSSVGMTEYAVYDDVRERIIQKMCITW